MYHAILEDVQEIIADYLFLPREAIVPEADLRQHLGMDSLDLVELTMIFERAFGSNCRQRTKPFITNVAEIAEYLLSIGAVSARALRFGVAQPMVGAA